MRLLPILSLLLCLPSATPARNEGTPLPGLSEEPSIPDGQPKPAAPPDLPALQKKADAGDPEAQLQLAALIFGGGVPGSKPAQAATLLEKAADSGHAPAQFAFAQWLQSGSRDGGPDPERAKFLIQQAAESGHAPAQSAWGEILFGLIDPKGRDVSFAEPLVWIRKAADQSQPEAMCRLGMMQAAGQGMPPDAAAGWKLISKAARAGNAFALNEAGICLQLGRGVESDPTAAAGYFLAASDLGSAPAAVNLGLCYQRGHGVPQDFDKAGAAFARAAKSGNGTGQFLLAQLFEHGRGTAKNPVAAYINYTRAAAAGVPEAASRRDALKASLTAAQLREAEQSLRAEAPAEKK